MSGNDDFSAIDPAVLRLAQTIKYLMPHSDNGWVKWPLVARHQEGSEHYADLLSALAQLPESRLFFNANDKVVRLSTEGLRLADWTTSPRTDALITHEIAAAVRNYASRLGPIWLHIDEIWNVARTERRFVQALRIQLSDETFQTETPVKFYPFGSSAIAGRIVGQEPDGDILYVAFDVPVALPGSLSVDLAFLLTQLAQRIDVLSALPSRAETLLSDRRSLATVVAQPDSQAVADELAAQPKPWTRLLWGPPGAGKTYALGRLVVALLLRQPETRILLVAPSNRAVDVALDQCIRQIQDSALRPMLSGRKVLRFGYPRAPEILERTEVLGPTGLDQLAATVRRLSKELKAAENSNAATGAIAVLRAELLAIQEDIKRRVAEHVENCRVVATTTALAYLSSSPIGNIRWDTVLVDEVTMVPPAVCVYLASLAEQRLLLAGDPRQLGPVYKQTFGKHEVDFEWLGRDIFDKSQVSQGEGLQQRVFLHDDRLARITRQRRCADPLWDHVKHLYPNVDSLPDINRVKRLAQLPPKPGHSVVLQDTAEVTQIAECQKAHKSWENPRTAELALRIAADILIVAQEPVSIVIITPYRAQVKRLRRLLREKEREGAEVYRQVQAGTVHQFQGSEADVVIFDMVDGPGRSQLGLLLSDATGLRLVNVAITRARGKLIVLADRLWCQRNMTPADNPLLWGLIGPKTTND